MKKIWLIVIVIWGRRVAEYSCVISSESSDSLRFSFSLGNNLVIDFLLECTGHHSLNGQKWELKNSTESLAHPYIVYKKVYSTIDHVIFMLECWVTFIYNFLILYASVVSVLPCKCK